MKKYISIVIAIVVVIGLAFLTTNNSHKGLKKVGILIPADLGLMDEITKGIKTSFEKAGYKEGVDISFDIQSSHGDNSTLQSIATKFANGDYDLLVPYGTGASQAILHLVNNKPIVFAAVTDPKTAGLVADPANPGKNITGTSDVTLYKESLELIQKISPNAKKIGVLHNPGEANSVFGFSETKKYAQELGLQIVEGSVNSSADVYPTAQALSSKVDAFYVLPDITVISGTDAFIKATLENKKSLIVFGSDDVKKGGLASLGTNYEKVGEKTGDIMLKVLSGTNPGSIPVLGVTDADVFINAKTARSIGITIPTDLLKSATIY